MINSKKIAIALLVALVGTFAVAAPAIAMKFKLYVYNNTGEKADKDEGTKIQVSIYKYSNGKIGSLKETMIISPKVNEATGIGKFIFNTAIGNTQHRRYLIKTVDNDGKIGKAIGSGRVMMRVKTSSSKLKLEDIVDFKNDNFTTTTNIKFRDSIYVYVTCNKAGVCED